MLTLKQWMELVNYRITEGSEYGWKCYGHNAYSLNYWNGIHDAGGFSSNIVFDTVNQTVYEVDVCDYTNGRAYRVIHSDYKAAYNSEAKNNSYANQAWDNVNFTDLEVDEDWLDKAKAIVAGKDYDTRISVPVDFTDEELLKYMKLAHERDITFNQLVEEALRSAIDEFHRDPEKMQTRVKDWKGQLL